MAIVHAKVTAEPDDGTSDVSADEWNDDHNIEAGTIVNADINASAAIALTKLASIPGFSTVFKTADETINSDSTLTDDADLQFSVDASSIYGFMAFIKFSSNTNPDWQQAFSVPAGTTIEGNGQANGWNSDNTINDLTVAETEAISGSALKNYQFDGIIDTDTTSGTVAFQWAQQNSAVDDTILRLGSWIAFIKLN